MDKIYGVGPVLADKAMERSFQYMSENALRGVIEVLLTGDLEECSFDWIGEYAKVDPTDEHAYACVSAAATICALARKRLVVRDDGWFSFVEQQPYDGGDDDSL